MKKIFETIAAFKFQIFDEEIKNLSEPLALATINLFLEPKMVKRNCCCPFKSLSLILYYINSIHYSPLN
jgi:hypothetical protein